MTATVQPLAAPARTVDETVEAARIVAIDDALRMTVYAHRPLTLPDVDYSGVLPMLTFAKVDDVAEVEQYGTFRLSDEDEQAWTDGVTAYAFGQLAGRHAWNVVVSWPIVPIAETGRCWFPRCEDGLGGCAHVGVLDGSTVMEIVRRVHGEQALVDWCQTLTFTAAPLPRRVPGAALGDVPDQDDALAGRLLAAAAEVTA